jgi:two-component system sensor histidine kinase DesK
VVVVLALAGPQLALTAANATQSGPVVYSALLMAGLLVISLHHVWHAARGLRAPGAVWSLGAMAVVVAIGVPVAGPQWVTTFAYLLASAVLVLPRRAAVLAGVVILVALVPISLLPGPRPNPVWMMIVVVERAGAIVVPVWLAGALRSLRAARAELAVRAVLRERGRIDDELSRTVGESLSAIAAAGAEAGTAVATDPEVAATKLTGLVEQSRRTLADARLLVRGYQHVGLRAELETAVTLLTSAGVAARLVLPHDLPDNQPVLRAELRAAVEELLRKPVPACVISVQRTSDGQRLVVEESTG